MKFKCAHCGQPTYSPLRKGLCGGMSSAGKECPECSGRCVNGKVNLIVSSVLSGIALIIICVMYFMHSTRKEILLFGVLPLVLSFVMSFVFNMFFGELIPAIRRK